MERKLFREIKGYGANELDSALRSVLEPGERVLWKGRPRLKVDYTAFLIWIFAIPWTGFSLFWTLTAWSMARAFPPEDRGLAIAALVFPAFGLPFILVGVVMLAAPFFAITVPGRTLNAVTDRRVMRIVGGWKSSLREVPGEMVASIDTKPKPDGTGTLVLTFHPREGDAKRPRLSSSDEDGPRHMAIPHLPNVRAAARAAEEMRLSCAASSLSAGRGR